MNRLHTSIGKYMNASELDWQKQLTSATASVVTNTVSMSYRKFAKYPVLWSSIQDLWEQAARIYSNKVRMYSRKISFCYIVPLSLFLFPLNHLLHDLLFYSLSLYLSTSLSTTIFLSLIYSLSLFLSLSLSLSFSLSLTPTPPSLSLSTIETSIIFLPDLWNQAWRASGFLLYE